MLRDHCGHARYISNLAVERAPMAPRPDGRAGLPGAVPAASQARAELRGLAGGFGGFGALRGFGELILNTNPSFVKTNG